MKTNDFNYYNFELGTIPNYNNYKKIGSFRFSKTIKNLAKKQATYFDKKYRSAIINSVVISYSLQAIVTIEELVTILPQNYYSRLRHE